MVHDFERGTYGGEHPFRSKTPNTPARTRNNANIRMYKRTNAPAPTAAQSPASGSSHEAAGAAAAAPPPLPSVAMAPSPACPSGSVSAAIAPPSGSSPAVARGFDLTGVSSVVPSAPRSHAFVALTPRAVVHRGQWPARSLGASTARPPARSLKCGVHTRKKKLEERDFCRDPPRPQTFFSKKNLRHPVNELLSTGAVVRCCMRVGWSLLFTSSDKANNK